MMRLEAFHVWVLRLRFWSLPVLSLISIHSMKLHASDRGLLVEGGIVGSTIGEVEVISIEIRLASAILHLHYQRK